ncbi:hypothetical protein PVK06_038457 [Gossypium arboreum]|uniref:Uncharacterized protein n=1 Tax=Gossypium arboreum TaxID=29729 RepID=A0ABR0N0L1_GOSAR|nr:hypothetical protein PVK06_038457 [Gossypium arboreum]
MLRLIATIRGRFTRFNGIEKSGLQTRVEKEVFGPWMLFKQRWRGKLRSSSKVWFIKRKMSQWQRSFEGSRFVVLEVKRRRQGSAIMWVKGKGVNENFGLKSIGRVLKPNNGGVEFVPKKNASGSSMGALLDRVGNDGVLG